MKHLLAFTFLLAGAFAFPSYPMEDDGIHKWSWVKEENGTVRWIDLNVEDSPKEPETYWNPQTDIHFLLFTKSNPSVAQEIKRGDAGSIRNSNFNGADPTRYIIHGWNNDGSSAVNILLRTAFLQKGSYNVISVDWGEGAQTIDYYSARNRITDVAKIVADFMQFARSKGGSAASREHILGHSLGAHCAGLTGKNLGSGRPAAIFGMDPALPLFSIDKPDERLADTDATYVEVIHTDAGNLGFESVLGQVDFYPNGGKNQPGCIDPACDHSRSYQYVAESINSAVGFWGVPCPDKDAALNGNCDLSGTKVLMAANAVGKTKGIYWLATNSQSPYAQGQ